jgi:flagellar basal-body rod protein FlgB
MFEDLLLFGMAQRSLDWLSRREEVLSQNVANANTPKYQAKDLAPLTFKNLMASPDPAMRAVMTHPMHLSPEVEQARFETVVEKQPEESKPDGNTVLLEEQMQKIGEVKGKYDLAVNLYMKNINMLKMAIGK